MKKYTIKSILILAIGCMLHSCLDLDPKDQIADGNYWQTATDFKLFSNQFYGWTRDFKNSVYDAPHSDKRSDLIMDKGSKNVFANGTNSIPASDGNYTDAYNRIRRTNILLQKAESFANQSDIAQYIGEAKFFRAYCYFDLLQLFGNVIVVTTPIDVTAPEMQAARNDRSEVADLIIQDLKDAAELLPVTSTVEKGRVGREGAWAMLSRVALYEGTWQKFRGNTARGKDLLDIAANAAKEVINTKNFSLFAPAILGDSAQKYMFILEDTKCNPAGLQKSANTEYIFSRRHDEALAPIGVNITKECLANAQMISHKFAAMYLCQDGLPIEKSEVYKGDLKILDEYLNRDNRMIYTLCKPYEYFWSNKIRTNRSWMAYAGIIIIIIVIVSLFVFKNKKTVSVNATVPDKLPEDSQPEKKVTIQPTESYVKLSEKEASEVIDALKKYMQEQQAYLNVDLKQSEVAVAIGYPTYLLSAIFTHYLKMGYYDFVNSYRVEQFKQSVSEGKHKKYTLVTLAEKCGFKSKASFFRAFKKFTGTTPNEYIQQFDKE